MIQIINLGLNNLSSLVRSLEEASGQNVEKPSSVAELKPGNLLVLPGTGSFGEGMKRLEERGFCEALTKWVARGTGMLAGVCLGMHLLAARSEEAEGVPGLAILDAQVEHLGRIAVPGERVPHVGWSGVSRKVPSSFQWTNTTDGTDFYFSHSFHLVLGPTIESETLRTDFGVAGFVSALRKDNVVGFQFHPEKSSEAGIKILSHLVEESTKVG